jgi:hypothetical protein
MSDNLKYTKVERLWLRDRSDLTEKWVQDVIADDPKILGLGEVELMDRERRQPRAGRLDLLLADPEENRRYEVELQLGATDESHVIRCIEYWDVERRRYPGYDHCAVIVAEDITSRFLNVLSLFSGSIPLIALQLHALKIGDQVALSFVRVLDYTYLREEDGPDPPATDRAYWSNRASARTISMVDTLLEIVNQKAEPKQQLTYNKSYIGLSSGTRSRNFIYFRPKKEFTHVSAEVADKDSWIEKLEQAGLDATSGGRYLRVTVYPKDLEKHRQLLMDLLHKAVEELRNE